jgi:hypothetical protein
VASSQAESRISNDKKLFMMQCSGLCSCTRRLVVLNCVSLMPNAVQRKKGKKEAVW